MVHAQSQRRGMLSRHPRSLCCGEFLRKNPSGRCCPQPPPALATPPPKKQWVLVAELVKPGKRPVSGPHHAGNIILEHHGPALVGQHGRPDRPPVPSISPFTIARSVVPEAVYRVARESQKSIQITEVARSTPSWWGLDSFADVTEPHWSRPAPGISLKMQR